METNGVEITTGADREFKILVSSYEEVFNLLKKRDEVSGVDSLSTVQTEKLKFLLEKIQNGARSEKVRYVGKEIFTPEQHRGLQEFDAKLRKLQNGKNS